MGCLQVDAPIGDIVGAGDFGVALVLFVPPPPPPAVSLVGVLVSAGGEHLVGRYGTSEGVRRAHCYSLHIF